jgi:hypothetical protein
MSAITDPEVGADSGAAQTISLDGRSLLVAGPAGDDRPGAGASFRYTQSGDLVHAVYSGGRVRLGHRVGIRRGNHLEFRWAEVLESGEARGGRADARLEVLADGRIRLHEIWAVWEPAGPGRLAEGIGVAEETAAEPAA